MGVHLRHCDERSNDPVSQNYEMQGLIMGSHGFPHHSNIFFFFILDHDWAGCDVCFCLHVRFKVSTGKLSPFSRGMWKQSCSSPSDSAQWSSNIQVKSQAAKQDFLRGILKGKHQFYTSGSVYSTFGAFCLCVCVILAQRPAGSFLKCEKTTLVMSSGLSQAGSETTHF